MNLKKVTLLIAFVLMLGAVMAQKSQVFTTGNGAIKGYDPVAFFKAGKPVMGLKEYSYEWNGATWYFSSNENLSSFKATPEKYAPQYGGYCAYGTAEGHKAPTETDTWTIVGDKLYFNYNKSVQALWKENQRKLIEKANSNWPMIKDNE